MHAVDLCNDKVTVAAVGVVGGWGQHSALMIQATCRAAMDEGQAPPLST